MVENNREEIDQIEQKAKEEDNNAKNASEIVNHSISNMNPQRQYNQDNSQNKR
ncbi:hypothetical protein [Metabacillus arenae]|uniref:Uncharacterized protein n=1 Tax=Metabacillus arenae TaxID=2771434 RepID=A0A926NMK4_9BACI|nr:hypothetical protein [Metabacillus arenae]MBD1380571.1 hypothetical protein [Metabacillus arenae]